MALEKLGHDGCQFWFYRTQNGTEIDLVVEHEDERIGYEFKCSASVSRHDTSGLRAGIADGVITRGMVAYAGSRRYPVTDDIEAIPADMLLTQYQKQVTRPFGPSANGRGG